MLDDAVFGQFQQEQVGYDGKYGAEVATAQAAAAVNNQHRQAVLEHMLEKPCQ
jgi:hypothetical protein